MPTAPLICVVDDDVSILDSLPGLLRSFGFGVAAFSSGAAFLHSGIVSETACLLLDVSMPDMSGPALQARLTAEGLNIPIVFITAQVEGEMRRHLLEQGAIDLLPKPFSEEALLHAIHRALQSGHHDRRE
jgi:FixJ family two-component response regulator